MDEVPLIIIFRKDNISAADVSANDKQAILLRNQQVEGLSPPNQVVSSNELKCSSVLDLQCGLAHRGGNAGGRSLSPHSNDVDEAPEV